MDLREQNQDGMKNESLSESSSLHDPSLLEFLEDDGGDVWLRERTDYTRIDVVTAMHDENGTLVEVIHCNKHDYRKIDDAMFENNILDIMNNDSPPIGGRPLGMRTRWK